MPRSTEQQRSSTFSIDGPGIVSWLILAGGLGGSLGLVVNNGWSVVFLAGGVAVASLAWWALLRVLVQTRDQLSDE